MFTDFEISVCCSIETPGATRCNNIQACAWNRPGRGCYPRFLVVVAITACPSAGSFAWLGSFANIILTCGTFVERTANISDNPVACTTVVIQITVTRRLISTWINPAGDNSATGLITCITIGIPAHPESAICVINICLSKYRR